MWKLDTPLITIPKGYLIISPQILNYIDEAHLRDFWLRTRSASLIKLVENKSSRYVFTRGNCFGDINKQLIKVVQELSQQDPSYVWELSLPSGRIQRGKLPITKNLAETNNKSLDRDNKNTENSEPGTNSTSTDIQGSKNLRSKKLFDITLPQETLTNMVAAYLGRPTKLEHSWTTSAPVVGVTLNWNGKETRTLTWSGHQDTFTTSKTLSLLEGIERKVGAYETKTTTITAKATDLPGSIITPNDFPAYPPEFYNRIGYRYNPNEQHEWVEVENLNEEHAWIPREYIYYGENTKYNRWAYTTSSGCATGINITEARLFGLLELIERDAFVGAWYAGIKPKPINLKQIKSIKNKLIRAKLLNINIQCGILPSICEIPVIISSATYTNKTNTISSIGAACHPSLIKAIESAVNEVWTYIHERIISAEKTKEKSNNLARNPYLVEDIEDHILLLNNPNKPEYKTIIPTQPLQTPLEGKWQQYAFKPAQELLEHLIKELTTQNISVWFHTQTSPFERECGLETVKTISPELLPLDFGWNKQRALQSKRLKQLANTHDSTLRLLPHPFS